MWLAWSNDALAKESYAGVRGGVNIADITGDDAEGLDTRNRILAGAFYGIDFEDFGVRIDGLYAQKGAEGSFVLPGDDHPHETIVSLDYIEFPVLFMVGFPTGDKFAVNLFAGPTFGFNLNAEAEIPDHGETMDLEDVQTFEFGGAFGGGFEYMLSSMSFVADLRYALSATSVSDEFDGKNTGVGVTVGVKFPLGAR